MPVPLTKSSRSRPAPSNMARSTLRSAPWPPAAGRPKTTPNLTVRESAVEATAARRNPEVPVRVDDLRAEDAALPNREGRRNNQRVESEKLMGTAWIGRARRCSLPRIPARVSEHQLRLAVEHLATSTAASRRSGTAATRSNVRVWAATTAVRYQERPQGGFATMGELRGRNRQSTAMQLLVNQFLHAKEPPTTYPSEPLSRF